MRQQHQYVDCGPLVDVRIHEQPMRTWVTAVGELDLSTTDAFDQCLWEAQTHGRRVVLDLRALVFIDSAGLRSVLAAQLRAVKWHHRLDVVCSTGQVRRMLSLSGFDELVKITESPAPTQVYGTENAPA